MGDLEAISGAARNWTEYAFGSMLLVVCIWHYLTVKAHREEIKEWKGELQKERDSHDRTRERHENNNNAIRGLAEAIKLTQDGIRELTFERRQQ
jgi:hypothetical protein